MHIILQKYIEDLAKDFELESFNDSKLFEFFCNFCVVSKIYLGRFNPKDITTDEDDASIDELAIIIDGDLILSEDDALKVFETHKSNFTVDIIFTQIKSSENFKKNDISNFKMGIEDFLSLDPQLPNGKLNSECLAIFNVILNNLKKIKNRRPNAYIYYCTSGTYKGEIV